MAFKQNPRNLGAFRTIQNPKSKSGNFFVGIAKNTEQLTTTPTTRVGDTLKKLATDFMGGIPKKCKVVVGDTPSS